METMKEDRSFMYMVEINEKFIVIAAHDGMGTKEEMI
jgi:hypothetical protein